MGGQESFGGVTVAWGVGTDVGHKRQVNEDAVMAQPPVFVVADGMGGHEAGDVASTLLTARFGGLSRTKTVTGEQVVAAISEANEEIFAAGSAAVDGRSMGTTAVGLVLVENGGTPSWLLFNVGDSRAYRSFSGALDLLSVDHSYVQELVTAGQLDADAARTHPQRNVVTRALGVDPSVAADFWLRSPEVGERFLLCSDGLSSEIGDDEIARQLARGADPDVVASALVASALDAGGRDNVTVLVIDVIEVRDAVEQITSPRGEVIVEAANTPVAGIPSADGQALPDPATDTSSLITVPGELSDTTTGPADEADSPSPMIDGVPAEWPAATDPDPERRPGSDADE